MPSLPTGPTESLRRSVNWEGGLWMPASDMPLTGVVVARRKEA